MRTSVRHTQSLSCLAVVGAIALALTACSGSGSGSDASSAPLSPPPSTIATTPTSSSSSDAAAADFAYKAVATGEAPGDLTEAFGSIWVMAHRGGEVDRIDPATGRTVARVKSPGNFLISAAAGAGHVWYLDAGTQQIEGIDARTNRIDRKIDVDIDGGALSFGAGFVWFTGVDGTLRRIDPLKARVTGTRNLAGVR